MELKALTISSLRNGLESGEVRAVDVCRAALDQIERLSELNLPAGYRRSIEKWANALGP